MVKTRLEIEEAVPALKLLGDKTRLTILGMLKNGECCVCEFTEVLEMSQPSVSQHLRKLRDAKLVKEDRRGQWVFYSLNENYEAYDLVLGVIGYVSDQSEKIAELERQGKRIECK
ncbi:ArsR/SmtB family transcription factor [Salimicrobium salexigens]|uniref:Transcriptional regulator, ArsR family n=1 Tax=Salimicrobium salexigens TaxID=908941 RepID=A0ABY1KWA7_9BACI|nr:metalloregulator ArsR/SmtB family transcription factor [Salimicrobium salexigens]SIS85947.1 transcriptional regulator, ArsR family [Salimicrobium salexigens]